MTRIVGDMIAEQQSISCPEEHVLAIINGGQGSYHTKQQTFYTISVMLSFGSVVQALADEECPQEINKKWDLENSVPSEKFIAYMKRAHLQDGQRQHTPTGHEY